MRIDWPHSPTTGPDRTPTTPAPRALSARELAHELNSLLDGSLRYLALADAALAENLDEVEIDDARRRIARARAGLGEMATVLSRAMRPTTTGAQILRQAGTIGDVVRDIIDAQRAAAADAGVELRLHIAAAAAALPAGALGALLGNGVRNAVQACTRGSSGIRRVEVTVATDEDCDELSILVTDTGPGLPRPGDDPTPGGHGIGLSVCREIVDELGGRLALVNVPFGRGAIMDVRLPIRSLRES
ncbi:MAG: ATP-binding protein [Planctomycetota bacterium]|jgi:signal transduction histidine kinase